MRRTEDHSSKQEAAGANKWRHKFKLLPCHHRSHPRAVCAHNCGRRDLRSFRGPVLVGKASLRLVQRGQKPNRTAYRVRHSRSGGARRKRAKTRQDSPGG